MLAFRVKLPSFLFSFKSQDCLVLSVRAKGKYMLCAYQSCNQSHSSDKVSINDVLIINMK